MSPSRLAAAEAAVVEERGHVSVRVQLLGRPRVDASTHQPARKSWAVFAYLTLAGPTSRRHLAELLFDEADDPLGALRWSLSDLRRALGAGGISTGDPVTVEADHVDVDALRMEHADWQDAVALAGFGKELLEGVDPAASAAFELWLLAERRRLFGLTTALLHEASLASLAAGNHAASISYAQRLVQLDAAVEDSHALLVRSLVAAGRRADAEDHARSAEKILAGDQGARPVAQIQRALATPPPRGTSSAAAIEAELELGQAAVNAGAVADGVVALERAVTMARQSSDVKVRIDALVVLGSALVHAARGNDEEGAAVLHEAAVLAEQHADGYRLAEIWRELGWIAFLRGEYERAHRWLDAASGATTEAADTAWIDLVSGACWSDQGRQDDAIEILSRGIDTATQTDDLKGMSFARSFRARSRLFLGDLNSAAEDLDTSIDEARRAQWVSVLPWPIALRSEVSRLDGDLAGAAELGERAFELGCRIGDPCWEGMGARAIALAAAAGGDLATAETHLEDARNRARRQPDTYVWARLWIDQARCALALRHGDDRTPRLLGSLQEEAATRGMRGLVHWTLAARNDVNAADQILGSGKSSQN